MNKRSFRILAAVLIMGLTGCTNLYYLTMTAGDGGVLEYALGESPVYQPLTNRLALPYRTRVDLRAIPRRRYRFNEWDFNMRPILSDHSAWLDMIFDYSGKAFFEPVSDQEKKGWLLMFYIAASNNLEAGALKDLNQIEEALLELKRRGKAEDREILDHLIVTAVVDRSPGSEGEVDRYSWSDTRFFILKPGDDPYHFETSKTRGWWGVEIEDLSMGSGYTLQNFIAWSLGFGGHKDRHGLILWSHGDGARSLDGASSPLSGRSIGVDEENYEGSKNRILYLDEVQQAVSAYYRDQPLDFLGFDACLMGTLEVAYEFRDLAKVMVASPGTVYGGWPYLDVLRDFSPDWTSEELALSFLERRAGRDRLIAESGEGSEAPLGVPYYSGYNYTISNPEDFRVNSMTAFYPGKSPAVKKAVDTLSQRLLPGPHPATDAEQIDAIQKAIRSGRWYCGTREESLSSPYSDLGGLMFRLRQEDSAFGGIGAEIGAVEKALGEMVLASWGGPDAGVLFAPDSEPGVPVKPDSETEWDGGRGWSYGSGGGDRFDPEGVAGVSIFTSGGDRSPFHDEKSETNGNDYAYQWWYTDERAEIRKGREFYGYGRIDFANFDGNGRVNTWRELFEALYDSRGYNYTSGTF